MHLLAVQIPLGYFADNRVVHSKHFWAIFGSFSHVWEKNDQNDPKNGMKNDVKNGYCEHPGKQK